MKKTRRSLYSRRRRLRGKGLGKALCAGALIAAISMVPAAAAREPTFYELAQKYATEGGWENSHNLAKYITDMNWATPENLYPEACTIPAGIDAEKVLEPYLLKEGTEYGLTITDGSLMPNASRDLLNAKNVLYLGETSYPDYDKDADEIDAYMVQKIGDEKGAPPYYIPKAAATLGPKKGGRVSRKSRRKTLRRKK